MKKLLTLLIIFGLASIANAGLVFTVNGAPQPDEITIGPSDIIELDLELDTGTITSYTVGYYLSNAKAELITDGASGSYPDITEPMTDIEFPAAFDFAGEISAGGTRSQYVQFGAGQFMSNPLEAPQVLMKELYVHCLEPGDVVLNIYVEGTTIIDGVTLTSGELLHTLTIHQIPEPMTIALLGLGGLFLRRRK